MEPLMDNGNEMYQIPTEKTEEFEIDVMNLLMALRDNIVSILLSACCLALVGYLYVSLAMVPTYTASATMYVINAQNSDASLTYSDLQSSTQLISDSKQLVLSDRVIKEAINNLGLTDVTVDQVRGNLSVAIVDGTRFLKVAVVNTDPYYAADLANMICEVSCEAFQEIMSIDRANVVDTATVPEAPSGPSVKKYVLGGGLIGAVLMILFVMIRYLMDDTLKTTEDIEKYLGLSVLGSIPEMEALSENKKSKKKSKKKKHKK